MAPDIVSGSRKKSAIVSPASENLSMGGKGRKGGSKRKMLKKRTMRGRR